MGLLLRSDGTFSIFNYKLIYWSFFFYFQCPIVGLLLSDKGATSLHITYIVVSGPLTASSNALSRLVRYLVIRAYAYCFAAFLSEYSYWIPVIVYVSLKLDITCVNWVFS